MGAISHVRKKRTITLTVRPPVAIDPSAWPVIANASETDHDGQVICRANRVSEWYIGVRQHADGRAIVYATYDFATTYRGSRDFSAKHGEIVPPGGDICAAIVAVADRMSQCESYETDASRWDSLARECIADMPAEELS